MGKNLKTCFQKLKFIAQIKNPNLQKKLLNEISSEVCTFKALKEIAINFLSGNIQVKKRGFKKYNKFLKMFNRRNLSKSNKKKLVVQSGGFLGVALPILTTLLGELL